MVRQPPRMQRTGSSTLRDRLTLAVCRPQQLHASLGELERFFRGASRARRELQGIERVAIERSLDGVVVASAVAALLTGHRSPPFAVFYSRKQKRHGRSPWPYSAVCVLLQR